jgi:hypothetical protein
LQPINASPIVSFFPEPIDPGLLQMVDTEARGHGDDSQSSNCDSLQEVLFKQLPVKPPPVAVNMYVDPRPMPLSSLSLTTMRGRRAVGASGLAAPECLSHRPRLKFLFETR